MTTKIPPADSVYRDGDPQPLKSGLKLKGTINIKPGERYVSEPRAWVDMGMRLEEIERGKRQAKIEVLEELREVYISKAHWTILPECQEFMEHIDNRIKELKNDK